MLGDVDIGSGTLRFAKDYVGLDYHNDGHSHIDALCHVAFDGAIYNGKPSGSVTSEGATVDTIDVVKDGLVGRGVLLDVPRLRGVPWLEPGEHVFPEDLERAEREQGVTVGEGDILLVRTGHARRRAELEPWDTPHAKAGLHPTAALFLAERRIAALGSDGNSDTAPSTTEGIDFPIHALTLNAMGVHLLDYLQFEDLVAACEAGRTLGVPVRRRTTAHRRRDGITPQPDCDLLTAAPPRLGRGGAGSTRPTGVPSAAANTARMEQQAPSHWPGRRFQRNIERKGLRPRFAAYFIVASWALGVVVFGVIERLVDPHTFDNIWLGMWWAIQTVTTVGYGDVVPGSTAGKVIAAFMMLGGLSLLAVLTGLITSAFVAQAQAQRHADREDPMMEKLEEMSGRLEAINADLARLQRGSEPGG